TLAAHPLPTVDTKQSQGDQSCVSHNPLARTIGQRFKINKGLEAIVSYPLVFKTNGRAGDPPRSKPLGIVPSYGGFASLGLGSATFWSCGRVEMVGPARFELVASCTPSKRASQAALRPDRPGVYLFARYLTTSIWVNDDSSSLPFRY